MIKSSELLYYLAPIGGPNYDDKLSILKQNLIYIHNNIDCNFDVAVNSYLTKKTEQQKLVDLIKSLKFINKTYYNFKQGWLAEVFLDNPDNQSFAQYEYILFIVDDVKILNFPMYTSMALLDNFNADCMSPRVERASHDKWFVPGINRCNRIEIYCLLIPGKNFDRFIDLFDKENPNIWGVDSMFGYKQFYPLVCNVFSVEHYFKNDLDEHRLALKTSDMNKQITKDTNGLYKNPIEIHAHFKLVHEEIINCDDKALYFLENNLNKSKCK